MKRLAMVALTLLVAASPSMASNSDVDATPDELDSAVNLVAEEWPDGHSSPPANGPGSPGDSQVDEPNDPDHWECTIVSASSVGCGEAVGNSGSSLPELTVGDIRRAVRQIAMPRLTLTIQPGEATLVNVPTIFYTTPTTLRRSLTLLGQDVDVVARPTAYTWHHGDGTSQTTSSPGRPYPAKDVVHRYRDPGDHLTASVDTTYTVEYRVEGGAWTDLGATLTAAGPSTTLDVHEAAPVLVKRR